jgi:hypothetical protein
MKTRQYTRRDLNPNPRWIAEAPMVRTDDLVEAYLASSKQNLNVRRQHHANPHRHERGHPAD